MLEKLSQACRTPLTLKAAIRKDELDKKAGLEGLTPEAKDNLVQDCRNSRAETFGKAAEQLRTYRSLLQATGRLRLRLSHAEVNVGLTDSQVGEQTPTVPKVMRDHIAQCTAFLDAHYNVTEAAPSGGGPQAPRKDFTNFLDFGLHCFPPDAVVPGSSEATGSGSGAPEGLASTWNNIVDAFRHTPEVLRQQRVDQQAAAKVARDHQLHEEAMALLQSGKAVNTGLTLAAQAIAAQLQAFPAEAGKALNELKAIAKKSKGGVVHTQDRIKKAGDQPHAKRAKRVPVDSPQMADDREYSPAEVVGRYVRDNLSGYPYWGVVVAYNPDVSKYGVVFDHGDIRNYSLKNLLPVLLAADSPWPSGVCPVAKDQVYPPSDADLAKAREQASWDDAVGIVGRTVCKRYMEGPFWGRVTEIVPRSSSRCVQKYRVLFSDHVIVEMNRRDLLLILKPVDTPWPACQNDAYSTSMEG